MKVSRAQAEENRARVIAVAGQLFRERGFDGIGVADLMKAAGLTHGGFYGNFKSKEDLIAQACGRALAGNLAHWSELLERPSRDPLAMLVRFYLSEEHRDAHGKGCVLAALGGEAARQGTSLRATFTEALGGYLRILSDLVRGRTKAARRRKALATLAAMVGAMVLARATDDPDLSREILAATAAELTAAPPAA